MPPRVVDLSPRVFAMLAPLSRGVVDVTLTYLGRDGFVEIDYMVHPTDPTKTRQPYANLPSDVATIFEEDSGGDVAMTVLIDGAVDWHEVTCFGGCSAFVTDGIDFYTVKSSNFSSSGSASLTSGVASVSSSSALRGPADDTTRRGAAVPEVSSSDHNPILVRLEPR